MVAYRFWEKHSQISINLILLTCKMGTAIPLLSQHPGGLTHIQVQSTHSLAQSRGFASGE